jgi:hypothetical protein
MHTNLRNELTARDGIIKLLSDNEVARVSTAEASPRFAEGDEYIDLENLSLGVRLVHSPIGALEHLIPKKAVNDVTWTQILALMDTAKELPKSPTP